MPDREPHQSPTEALAALRVEIDRIDQRMHEALIERGEIIDKLIASKASLGGGSAFRPAREAAMMRRLAERHRGLLPLDTVEGIWRIIISTFTYAQSHYSVHVDASGGDAAMRDSARFHFGFTVPYVAHSSAAAVIAAVGESAGDLGLIRIDGPPTAGAWWGLLSEPDAPKIIARLPFVERPDHPAGAPVFVVSKPIVEAAARDEVLFAILIDRWKESVRSALQAQDAEIISDASHEFGLSLVVAAPGHVTAEALRKLLAGLRLGDFRLVEIGSHASRFAFCAPTRDMKKARA